MNGNISILIDEFARTMSLEGAMRAAGFCGRGMTREAMRAIEENGEAVRAAIINYTAGADTDLSEDAALRCRRRIIREYERIAFSDDDTVKIADKLRALASFGGELYYQITLTFNPVSASHWIRRRFFDAPPDPDIFLHRSSFTDNRFIDPGYAARMKRREAYDPEGYRVYALGEWGGDGEGLILPRYTVGNFAGVVCDRVCLAQDFGYNHADCILRVGMRDGELYVMRELYRRELDTAELINLANETGFSHRELMYCDSAEPDRIKTWRRAGFAAVPVKKGAGSVASQIDFLKSHPLKIDSSCTNLLRELASFRWLRDPVSGRFTDVSAPSADDAIAALRYSTEHFRVRGGVLDKASLGL